MEDNKSLPQITEQLADNTGNPTQVSPVDYIYNSVKAKTSAPSLLESIDQTQEDADYISGMFNSSSDNKVSFNEDRININEAYTQLSDGSYITRYDEGFLKGADNEDRYAKRQSTGSKWVNGLGKFVGKTINNVVGGTLGTAGGAISAIVTGNAEDIYDNSFYDFLDDQNTKMDNFAANYREQEERDLNFGQSMLTSNFWADDFLGGLSFMAGTVISESLWAAATGGTSLTTTAARVGLRGSKYFNAAKTLTKGVKESQKTLRKYNRLSAMQKAAKSSRNYGKAGEVANLLRFTYTGAGFEAGMEARLYQKEQRDNFYRDFENLNGRKPTALEISEFENNVNSTTNALWVTNMALVGTSNFAVLGKTFDIQSPFKASSSRLNRTLFGTGEVTTIGEKGQRLSSAAIKRNKLQKTLGFGKAVLKNPFYEGVVEEGGQAVSSGAMENFVTSRYNPSEEVMGIAESLYESLSHTYGTKEGWKEVGLGALIGLIGGESSSALSGQGLFTEAKAALKDQDENSVKKAKSLNDNLGTKTVDRIFAVRFEEDLAYATELKNAEKEYSEAEQRGSVMGMANAQSKVMLSSVKNAVDFDYLEDQVEDFKTALSIKDPKEIAEQFGIKETEVKSKISELVNDFKEIGDSYKNAKEFANYIVSNNPKELEGKEDININFVKSAIAYQMVMTEQMEKNMEGAHEALKDSISKLNPQIASEYIQALNKFNQINRSKKEDVLSLSKSENRLKLKQQQLNSLNNRLLKEDQTKSTTEGDQKNANSYNNLVNKITEVQEEVQALTQEVSEKEGRLAQQKESMSSLNASTRAMASQLDTIDPLAGSDLVEQITLEETQNKLEELDNELDRLKFVNPQLVEKIARLGQEYKTGLEMWQRNADTLQDLADPKIGLNRVGTMIQKKKQAGETTIEFLKRLEKTRQEEEDFSLKIEGLIGKKSENTPQTGPVKNEQEKSEEDPGEDPTKTATNSSTPSKVEQLKQALKDLIGKNNFILQNFTNNEDELVNEKAPTQEEVDEYQKIREEFKAGDINKLLGKPVEDIGKRTKERSGLTDTQIQRYQELSQKMVNWRVVTATNSEGVSVQDILDEIEAYEQEIQDNDTQVTAEQVLEMVDRSREDFAPTKTPNSDIAQSPTYVNVAKDGTHTSISHLDIETIGDNFDVTFDTTENIGTEEDPNIVEVYTVSNADGAFKIFRQKLGNRLLIENKKVPALFKGMGLQSVKYNLKTAWGYVFKDGELFESDFTIEDLDPEVQVMNAQGIYELKKGDKIKFKVSTRDKYNFETIKQLIEKGTPEALAEAQANVVVYLTNKDGIVVGMLKAGRDSKRDSNFNKVREAAFNTLKEKLVDKELTLEDVLDDNSETLFNLPFETEVQKTFVGTPNIELNEDGTPKIFKISEENSDLIVGYGYVEDGKLNEDDDVRKTFIPKKKSTPYVIIQHKETKIAFPVGMSVVDSSLAEQVLDILESNQRGPQQIVAIVNLLKQNGIDPTDFNLDSLKDNSTELTRLLQTLRNTSRSYSKAEILDMSKEDFISNSEIVIDLNKEAFVSPKVKTSLSEKLDDLNEGTTTTDKKLTESERQDLLIQHLINTSKAKNEQEVEDEVRATGDDAFISEYLQNTSFRKQVNNASLANKTVPSIRTLSGVESLLQDIIDLQSEDVPLDLQEEFKEEVEDLINNATPQKLKALAQKILKASENRYKIVNNSVNTDSMYHIPTSQSEEVMFEQGFVKVIGDFYKKVVTNYSVRQLLEGLYNKHKVSFLPAHMNVPQNITLEQFIELMPDTLLDIYKLYYNSKNEGTISKKSAIVGNEQYLKEDFKGDFAEFIKREKEKGSTLYNKVLKHFQITDKGIIKDDLLTRDRIDKYEKELGENYNFLLEYSLINKHIDLQEQPQNVIFADSLENSERIKAINDPKLPSPKGKVEIAMDGTVVFSKKNPVFVKIDNSVYEESFSNSSGETVYEKIAEIDPDFITTEFIDPFSTTTLDNGKQVDSTKTNIKKTKGRAIDC